MLKNIGKFIIESIDKDEKVFIKEFKEKYITAIRESMDYDIRRQLEEDDDEDDEEKLDMDMDTDIGIESDEEDLDVDDTNRVKVDELIINTDEVTLNIDDENPIQDDENLELDNSIDSGEEIGVTGNEVSEIADEITNDLDDDEDDEIYESLLSEEDDELDIDMNNDGDTVDIPMDIDNEDDVEDNMLTDENLMDTMVVDANTIKINAKSVKTNNEDESFEDESFEDEFNDSETLVSDDGEDVYDIENVDDDDEIAEKCKINKKPIVEEDESEEGLMSTFENHLNEMGENGSDMRKNNPEEFAKKYSTWVKDMKGE